MPHVRTRTSRRRATSGHGCAGWGARTIVAAGLAGVTFGVALPAAALPATRPVTARQAAVVSAPTAAAPRRVAVPPRRADRASLVRLFARVDRVSTVGVVAGARIRTTTSRTGEPTETTRTRTRTRGHRYVVRNACDYSIFDDRTMLSYTHVPEVACVADVTPAQLAAALAQRGSSDATWVRIGFLPVLEDGASGSAAGQLGDHRWLADNATDWAWSRRHGRTTWTLRVSTPHVPDVTARIVLDRRGRVVREMVTTRWGRDITALRRRVAYGQVARIALPPATAVVDGDALFDLLDPP